MCQCECILYGIELDVKNCSYLPMVIQYCKTAIIKLLKTHMHNHIYNMPKIVSLKQEKHKRNHLRQLSKYVLFSLMFNLIHHSNISMGCLSLHTIAYFISLWSEISFDILSATVNTTFNLQYVIIGLDCNVC